MNILGIDHGTKRIGLSIARGGLKIAYPLQTIPNDEHTLTTLKNVLASEKVGLIVLGLPRNLNANDTTQTALVRQFMQDLTPLNLPIELQDETTTTDRALEKGASSADKDAWAAAIILQDYLERQG